MLGVCYFLDFLPHGRPVGVFLNPVSYRTTTHEVRRNPVEPLCHRCKILSLAMHRYEYAGNMMLRLHYEGPDSGAAGRLNLGKSAELYTVRGLEVWAFDRSEALNHTPYFEVFVLRTKKCWFQPPPSHTCCSAIRSPGCEGSATAALSTRGNA